MDAVGAMDGLPAPEKARIIEDLRSLGNTGGRNPSALAIARAQLKAMGSG